MEVLWLYLGMLATTGALNCASSELLPLLRSVTEHFNGTGYPPVVLWGQRNWVTNLPAWITAVPITRIVETVYFPDQTNTPLYKLGILASKAILFVPFQPNNYFARDAGHSYGGRLIQPICQGTMVLVSDPTLDVRFPVYSCTWLQVITVNDTVIDAPDTHPLTCEGRVATQKLTSDTFYEQDRSRLLRNIPLLMNINTSTIESTPNIPLEVVAYVKALTVLNVTPIYYPPSTNILSMPDYHIKIEPPLHPYYYRFNPDGFYGVSGVAIFSRKILSEAGAPLSSGRSLGFLAFGLAVSGTAFLIMIHLFARVLSSDRDNISNSLMFLTASMLGRAPLPMKASRAPLRMVNAIWLLGTFMIGTFLQSQLTSELNVPMYVPAADTFEDLRKLSLSGKMIPCFDYYRITSVGARLVVLKAAPEGIGIRQLVGNMEECLQRARNGTHACITDTNPLTVAKARKMGLTRSSELLEKYYMAVHASNTFRYVLQHRRLVRTLVESGLVIHDERALSQGEGHENTHPQLLPFSKQIGILIFGWLASCGVTFGEILSKYLKEWRAERLQK